MHRDICKDAILEWNNWLVKFEVGSKWQYMHAARDFLGHGDVLLQSLRQSVVVGYVVPVAGGPLSPRWTRQQLDSCLTVAGGPLCPHWTRQQLSALDSCLTVAVSSLDSAANRLAW